MMGHDHRSLCPQTVFFNGIRALIIFAVTHAHSRSFHGSREEERYEEATSQMSKV